MSGQSYYTPNGRPGDGNRSQWQPGQRQNPPYHQGNSPGSYSNDATGGERKTESESSPGPSSQAPACGEPKQTVSASYQRIEPKAEKRAKLLQSREEGERVLQARKEAASMRSFREKGRLGGFGLSENQARQSQAESARRSKYDKKFKEEERQRRKKEQEEAEIQKKKDEARRKALRLEEREKMKQERQGDLRQKRLERFEGKY